MPTNPARRWTAAAIAAAAATSPAVASAAAPTTEELLQKIDELSQKVLVLERKLEIQDETTRASVASTPVVKAGPRGFSLQSADGANQVKLRGVLHVDGRSFVSDEPAGVYDSWQTTRARPILEGTLGGIYDFRFTPDFGQGRTVIQDAYVTGRFHPSLQVTAGKFKVPVGLERLQSANDIRFVSRALPTSLAPNRDIGLQVAGTFAEERYGYALAWTNGTNDGGSSEAFADVDVNGDKEWAARLHAQPFVESEAFALRGLMLGVAGTWGDHTGTTSQTLLASYRTPGGATFFNYRTGTTATFADGDRTRLAPQLYYSLGRFGLLGEYTTVSQDVSRTTPAGVRSDSVDTDAWHVAAHWFLTGEEQSFRGFKPNAVFSPAAGTWGAWELVARYHQLEVGDEAFAGGADSFADPAVAAQRASAFGVGVNWYLNENLKWMLDYEQTRFDGGAANGDRADEEVVLTRFALGF